MFVGTLGFTGLCERMGDGILSLLSRYLDLASEVVVYGGTIDKFITMLRWHSGERRSRTPTMRRAASLPHSASRSPAQITINSAHRSYEAYAKFNVLYETYACDSIRAR